MANTVYARLDREAWGSALPMSWDKVQGMWRHLNSMTWNYQMTFDVNVIANALAPSIRCSLIAWESVAPRGNLAGYDRARNVILQTTDPKQMEAALFMLINEAEVQLGETKMKMERWTP